MKLLLLSSMILQPINSVDPVGSRDSFKKTGLPIKRVNSPSLLRDILAGCTLSVSFLGGTH